MSITLSADETPAVLVALAPRVRLRAAAPALGLTVKAIERKIEAGKWVEGREYHRDPEGCIWIDIRGVMQWVEKGSASRSVSGRSASRSRSTGARSATL